MTCPRFARWISQLEALVASLSAGDEARFARIFHLDVTTAETAPPGTMEDWLIEHFGSLDAVRQQCIIKVTNRVTLEGALFNALRAQRPLQAPAFNRSIQEQISSREDCDFCRPEQATTADVFGRIRGEYCITASNVAKYDGWHALIIFDEHNPLRFTADQVTDYLDTAQEWARKAHEIDPEFCYPLFLWNCLWRSGASILHGHAQMVLTRGTHYAHIERWRQAAMHYRKTHDADYFADLIAVHHALGLAVDHGRATILPSLTPFKEKETLILARQYDQDLKSAVHRVLKVFLERLGVQSFNLVLYHPPLSETPEKWEDFPLVFRILDRGSLKSYTSDVGSMEFFAQSVVTTDPFRVAEALRTESWEDMP